MNNKQIPDKFPCVLIDVLCEAMGVFGEMTIQLEMEFDRKLDRERLARALDLLLDCQPVLGCRMVLDNGRPHWQRLDRDERRNFTVVENEEDYEKIVVTPMNVARGPQVLGCLIGRPTGDKLLLKVAHQASDAGGVKEISACLADIYRKLEHDPQYIPEPNVKGERSIRQTLRRVSPIFYPRIFLNYLREVAQAVFPGPYYRMPYDDAEKPVRQFVRHDIPPEKIARAAEFGRRKGSTLNDILLAAFFRSIAAQGMWDGKSQFRAAFTIDLRKYLPTGRGAGIANLSVLEWFRFGNRLGDNLEQTMTAVTRMFAWRKRSWFGYNAYIGFLPFLAILPQGVMLKLARGLLNKFKGDWTSNLALTNMGPIAEEDVDYDGSPYAARLLVPPMYPPLFAVGVSGYAGSISLTTGIYSSSKDCAVAILEGMESELSG